MTRFDKSFVLEADVEGTTAPTAMVFIGPVCFTGLPTTPAREACGTGVVGSVGSCPPPPTSWPGDVTLRTIVAGVCGSWPISPLSNCAESFINEAIMAEIACSWSLLLLRLLLLLLFMT